MCGPKQRCFIDKKGDGTFAARCNNPLQKTRSNKNKKKKNDKGNQHAKSTFIITANHDSNTKDLGLSSVDRLVRSLDYILLSLNF